MNPKNLVLVYACLICVSCSGDMNRTPFVQWDSAGVSIAESSAPVWPRGHGWRVADAPTLTIGTADGDPATQLYEVGAVLRLDDGRILVANTGTHEIRIFSASGEHLTSLGREGSGPGEFRWPRGLWVLPGDSLAVVDFERMTVFDSNGALSWSAPRGHSPVHMAYPGGMVLNSLDVGEALLEPGYARPTKALLRRSVHNAQADTLFLLSGDELFRLASDGGMSIYAAPFGARRLLGASEKGIVTANGGVAEVMELTHTGALRRIVRRQVDQVPVTRAAIDSMEGQLLQQARNDLQRERRTRLFREWSYPAHRARYDRLLIDSEGFVWLRESQIEATASSVWTVLDPDGRWLGDVRTPPALDIRQIGWHFVLGVVADDMGVERVRLYGLARDES